MLLGYASIDRLSKILTTDEGFGLDVTKKGFEQYLNGTSVRVETYDKAFEGVDEVKNSQLYANKHFKINSYAKLKISELNGTGELRVFTENFLSILVCSDLAEELVAKINESFIEDDYEIIYVEALERYSIHSLLDCLVSYDCLFAENLQGQHHLIAEHNKKCVGRILEGDYSGAITSSRSLLEQILREIQIDKIPSGRRGRYGGDFDKLLKTVLDVLKLPNGFDLKIKKGYEKLEEGFNTLGQGMNLLRHGMSDSHNITFEPTQKDALLAVNTSKTLANFIVTHYFEDRT